MSKKDNEIEIEEKKCSCEECEEKCDCETVDDSDDDCCGCDDCDDDSDDDCCGCDDCDDDSDDDCCGCDDCDDDSEDDCCGCNDCTDECSEKSLENIVKELENKILLKEADLINYRKRKDDEVREWIKYANGDLIYELIPVLDNFDRALGISEEKLTPEVKNFLIGFKMINDNMRNILNNFGVKEIESDNMEFDPNKHEAISTECNEKVKDNIILETFAKGYMFHDRVLRASNVKVNKIEESK